MEQSNQRTVAKFISLLHYYTSKHHTFNYLLPKFLCSYSLEYIFSSVHFSVMRLAAGSTSPVLSRALLQAV